MMLIVKVFELYFSHDPGLVVVIVREENNVSLVHVERIWNVLVL